MGLHCRPIKLITMKTIVIASRKGGTGKTTTIRNLAIALTTLKRKVLLIDTDSQGSLTLWCKARKQEDINLAVVPYDLLNTGLVNAEKAGYDLILIMLIKKPRDSSRLFMLIKLQLLWLLLFQLILVKYSDVELDDL